jgi:hypothetical protein
MPAHDHRAKARNAKASSVNVTAWSGKHLDAYLATVDLACPSSVYGPARSRYGSTWPASSPNDGCITRQIHEAARPAEDDQHQEQYLSLVLRTFIWGFPHQHHAPAPAGTTIALEIPGIGVWMLTRTGSGWIL